MTAKEFAAWLEGYLDGKSTLSKKQAEKIMHKAREVGPEYINYPYYPYVTWDNNRWTSGNITVTNCTGVTDEIVCS